MEDKLAFINSEFLEENGFHEVKDKAGNLYVRDDISVLFEFPDEKVSIRIKGIPDEFIDTSEKNLMLLLCNDSKGIKCPNCGGEIKAYCDHEGIYKVVRTGGKIVLAYTGDNPDYRGDPVFQCDDCGHKIEPKGKVIYV